MQYPDNKPVQLKVILLGEPGVGKTSLFHRYETIGNCCIATSSCLCTREFLVGPNRLPLEVALWDTANMERLHSLTDNYFREAEGAILVYDIADHMSLHTIPDWRRDCLNISPSAQLFLVGNKLDLEPQPFSADMNTIEQAECWSRELSDIEASYQVSAKDNIHVETMFNDIVHKLWSNHEILKKSNVNIVNSEPYSLSHASNSRKRLACCDFL